MTPDTIELACIISFGIGAIAGYVFRFIGTVPLKQYEKDIDFLIDGYENICNGYKSLNDVHCALSMFHEKRCDKSATSVRLYEVEVIEKKTLIRKSK